MCTVYVCSSFWEGATAGRPGTLFLREQSRMTRQEVAVRLLDILGYLQFCRMRLSVYSLLLQGLLSATANSAQVCCHLCFSCCPCFGLERCEYADGCVVPCRQAMACCCVSQAMQSW
jgi:hypothetical protein